MDTKMDLLHSVTRGRLEFFRSAAIASPLQGHGFENSAEGFFYYATGLQHPLFNGVMSDPDSNPSESEVENALDFFQLRKLPFIWWTDDKKLEDRGFRFEGHYAGMGLDISQWQAIPEEEPQYPITMSSSNEEASAFAEIFVGAFNMDVSLTEGLASIFQATTQAGNQIHYLASHEGKPIGIVTLSTTETSAGIWNLAVIPEYRNRGVASALVQGAIKEAQERKYDHVIALSSKEGPGRQLFDQFGFQEVVQFPYHLFSGSLGN